MATITSLPEAIIRMNNLTAEVVELSKFLNSMNQMFYGSSPEPESPKQSPAGNTPESMTDRVFAILLESGRPMRTREIIDDYRKRNWPDSNAEKGKLLGAISGSLSYLLNRKMKLQKTGAGYSIKPNNE